MNGHSSRVWSSSEEDAEEEDEIDHEVLRRRFEIRAARQRAQVEAFVEVEKRYKSISGKDLVKAYNLPEQKKKTSSADKWKTLYEKSEAEREVLEEKFQSLASENDVLRHELQKIKKEKERESTLRKQAERALAQSETGMRARQEAIEKERSDFDDFVTKQKKALARERRNILSNKSEHKNGITSQKTAELEAAKATIEKLRLEAEEKRKKARDREQALREVTKQQANKIQHLTEAVKQAEALHLTQAQTQSQSKKKDEPTQWTEIRDGILERRWPTSGKRQVRYKNGTVKTVQGSTSRVEFSNGDVKTTEASGRIVYFYAEAKTTHETDPTSGTDIFHFPNGQTETHYADGSKHIRFPDATTKVVHPDGSTKTTFPDGAVVLSDAAPDHHSTRRPSDDLTALDYYNPSPYSPQNLQRRSAPTNSLQL